MLLYLQITVIISMIQSSSITAGITVFNQYTDKLISTIMITTVLLLYYNYKWTRASGAFLSPVTTCFNQCSVKEGRCIPPNQYPVFDN